MKKSVFRGIAVAAIAVIAGVSLTACTEQGASATTASCAFVVGDGQNGHDAKLHKVVWPGQSVPIDKDGANDNPTETASYVPCNPRNYIVNDGSVKNANGDRVGDRFTPTVVYTSSGVQIKVSTTVSWTLNQNETALRDFYTLCFKYRCASDNDQGGDVNFSTKGWNGMLAEQFGPTVDAVARQAAAKVDDSIWQKHDPAEYAKLGEEMTKNFSATIRAKIGYPEDLFCGAGNSGWKDPANPGAKGNEFACTSVRITVDNVEQGTISSNDGTAGAKALNDQRFQNAKALYGDSAGFWLGVQDSIAQCKAANVTCVFNVGGANGTSVPVPAK